MLGAGNRDAERALEWELQEKRRLSWSLDNFVAAGFLWECLPDLILEKNTEKGSLGKS